jgi:Na+-transporting NADH:ubiquinone oxidoreductase subunit A
MKITINKGLNINLEGSPKKILTESKSPNLVALKPSDFPNLMPKMLVKVGDEVKCGSPVFCDKYNIKLFFLHL